VVGKALLLGEELLACVLGSVDSDVEKTMVDLQGWIPVPAAIREVRDPVRAHAHAKAQERVATFEWLVLHEDPQAATASMHPTATRAAKRPGDDGWRVC
jgi:hypothetical protein